MKKLDLKHKGFTLVELMIASTVFAMLLLIATTALIQIGRVYYKGIISSQTQESARSIIDEITRSIQFNGGSVKPVMAMGPSPSNYFCIDDQRYSFVLGRKLLNSGVSVTDIANETQRALVIDSDSVCSTGQDLDSPSTLTVGSKEMLVPNMRLAKLTICYPGMIPDAVFCPTPPATGTNLYHVTIRVVYGPTNALTPTKDECLSVPRDSQFCAVSELSTTVRKRVE